MKKIGICLLILCLAAGLTACAGAEETTVRVNEVTHSVFYAPLYAGMELGFFAEEGLALELTNGGGADKVMTALLTDAADIGLAGPESCIYVWQEGREDYAVVFAQLTKRDGSFLVGREAKGSFDWEQLRGSTVLGGRKGGVPEMTLEYVLRQHGLVPGEDVNVDTSVQFNMMAGAFTGGSGDYVTLFEPTATEVEREGRGVVLASLGQESGEIPYTAFFALKSTLRDRPELIDGFTRALRRSQTWVQEHSAAEIAEAIAPQFPDSDPELLTAVCQRHLDIDAWCAVPEMTKESFERLETVMRSAGELSEFADFDAIVDNSRG
ncbi:MAG: ABC transporter substrate-binding protein [Oscillospiraceae bacterium]|nr:ABC transporter substrate-binding protein [Oscillospiraceae bacterium]